MNKLGKIQGAMRALVTLGKTKILFGKLTKGLEGLFLYHYVS